MCPRPPRPQWGPSSSVHCAHPGKRTLQVQPSLVPCLLPFALWAQLPSAPLSCRGAVWGGSASGAPSPLRQSSCLLSLAEDFFKLCF